MKQPRKRLDGDSRREQFEQAATTLVSKKGFKAVTTDDIVQQAGVSKGLLWRYYTNLDDLMQHAAVRALKTLEKVIATDLDLLQPVPDLFRETIRRAAHLPQSHSAELLAIHQIVNNLRLPNGNLAITESNGYAALYEKQAAIITRGQREGSIDASLDAHLLARIYQGSIDTMLDQLMHDTTLDPDIYAAALSKTLLNGWAA